MAKRARDPFAVGILIFSLLLATLMLFLLVSAVRMNSAGRSTTPFVPPGWTNPTSPPPSAN